MRDELDVLEEWAGALLAKLEPGERRKLLGTMVRNLRRDQQKRIALQRSPDGKPYEPRKRRELKAKRGRVKAQMFRKLRGVRYMRTEHSGDAMAVGFMGRAARIAKVHQRGLRDRPQSGQAETQYSTRELLGLSDNDMTNLCETLFKGLLS